MRQFAVWFLFVLAACSTSSDRAANPHNYCTGKGYSQGTPEFDKCIQNYVTALCEAKGFETGSEEFGQCAENLRQSMFLRQQLELRGY